jgi:hypothetical protein
MTPIDKLNRLANHQVKLSLKFEDQIFKKLIDTIRDLIRHNLVLPQDASQMMDVSWQQAAFRNWKEEFQYSSICPECMIEIPGPRKIMHYHLKLHQSKHRGGEIFEYDDWRQKFRVAF